MIKTKAKILLGFILTILLSTMVTATIELNADEIKLNVDYKDFNNEDLTKIRVGTETFSVTNSDVVKDVNITVTATLDNSDYALVSSKTETVGAGATKEFILEFEVPHELDSGEEKIGTIKVSAGTLTDSAILKQVTKSMLIIDKLEVDYFREDNKKESDSFDEEDNDFSLSEDVLVGTEVTFTFKIQNLFDNDYDRSDAEIDSIELEIDVDDNDIYKDDFEDKYDIPDIEADKDETFEVSFLIDEEVDEGDFTFTITLEGEDGKGAKHKVEKELKLDLIRQSNDIRIVKTEISPNTIATCDSSYTLDLKVKNLGSDDQKYVGIAVFNTELGVDENIANIELNEFDDNDNYWENLFTFDLIDVDTGKYYIDVVTFYDRDEQSDIKRVPITIVSCNKEVVVPVPEETVVIPVVQDVEVTAPVVEETKQEVKPKTDLTGNVVRSLEKSYNQEDLIVGGVVVIAILLMAMIALFIAILVKK